MCMAHEIACSCGKKHASFHMKDSVLPYEVISNLYCPECSHTLAHDAGTMVRDNGWVIEYDMDVARLLSSRMKRNSDDVTPGFLFDEGWCTWNGFEPQDIFNSLKERQALMEKAKTDPKGYVNAVRTWSIDREERLRQEGWRKAALAAEPAGN